MNHDILDPDSRIEEDEMLWHYTDINGLLGIFSDIADGNGELSFHASSLYSMNDYKEVEFGISLLESALEEYLALGEAYGDFSDSSIYESRVRPLFQKISESGFLDIFSISFSRAGDQLSQWRGYADAGYAIGFDYAKLAKKISLGQGGAGRHSNFSDITYFGANHVQNMSCVNSLNSFGDIVSKIRDGSSVDDVLDLMHWTIMKDLPFWKSAGFSEEREVRFALWSNSGIKYKPSPLGPRAYIEHKIPLDTVKTVMVGPGRELDVRFATTNRFVEEKTGGLVSASTSGVTFRN